jgi:HlyD family secretion protein
VKNVAGNNARRFWDDDTTTKFEVSISLASTDPRMRPGLTAHVSINSDPRKNVLYVPRQALFLKDNKRVVYVRSAGNFETREVKIQEENESRAAIEGIDAGTEIGLVDPTAPRKGANSGGLPVPGGTL